MFKSTLTLTSGILLAVPGLASGTPIYVEYDTRIRSCFQCEGSGFSVGDRLAGWLRIDTDLAPPDRHADAPPDAQIHSQYWQPGRDFISGLGWPAQEFSNDEVQVIDDSGRFGFQGYSIWDHSFTPNSTSSLLQLQISTDDGIDDFIQGKELEQSFDSAALEGDVRFIGRLTRKLRGAVVYAFDLTLERFSVTPGQCRAP